MPGPRPPSCGRTMVLLCQQVLGVSVPPDTRGHQVSGSPASAQTPPPSPPCQPPPGSGAQVGVLNGQQLGLLGKRPRTPRGARRQSKRPAEQPTLWINLEHPVLSRRRQARNSRSAWPIAVWVPTRQTDRRGGMSERWALWATPWAPENTLRPELGASSMSVDVSYGLNVCLPAGR